ncbi:MAG: hypothetical protein ACUVSK_12875 [Desulfotomaculales bacterium]
MREPEKLERMPEEGEWFDLLPVEKKLIAGSLGLGIVLLFILIWVSYTLVPVAPK